MKVFVLLAQHFLVDDVVADRLAVEHAEDVLDGGDAHAVDRLARHTGDMGGGDEIGQGQEGVVLRGRLLVKDVERSAGDPVRLQRVVERLLIDDAAAGVLTMKAVRFICASREASKRPTVSGVFGQWIVIKSARATAASRSSTGS